MVAERRPEGARRLETAMRRMRTLRQSSLRRAVALRYEVSTVAESLDVFREVVGADCRPKTRGSSRWCEVCSVARRASSSVEGSAERNGGTANGRDSAGVPRPCNQR